MTIWTPNTSSTHRDPDLTACREAVWESGFGFGMHRQCTRKAVVKRTVDGREYGFCKQHDPNAVEARRAAKRAAFDAKQEARRLRDIHEKQTSEARVACRKALELIAAGHNDSTALAIEALSLFPPELP